MENELTIEEYMQRLKNNGAKFMKTNDNWFSNFPGDLVAVEKIHLRNGMWRVCVWGDDDFGMEIDVDSSTEMYRIYDLITEPISIYGLEQLGFYRS